MTPRRLPSHNRFFPRTITVGQWRALEAAVEGADNCYFAAQARARRAVCPSPHRSPPGVRVTCPTCGAVLLDGSWAAREDIDGVFGAHEDRCRGPWWEGGKG